jgi:putative transposase
MDVPAEIVDIFDILDPPMRQRKLSNREALRQLMFVMKTGVPWRHITVHQCKYWTVYKRFQSWVLSGVIDRAWKELTSLYVQHKLAYDPKWFHDLFIDTTMIKNVGGVDGLGKNPTDRGRLATKMSVIVDESQIPLCCEFFPANASDATTAIKSVDGMCCDVRRDRRFTNVLIGDKGYVSRHIEAALKTRNMRLLTPQKKNCKNPRRFSKADKDRLKRRHKVENFFCRMDKFKKIHCRHDKSMVSYRALTLFGMMVIVTTAQGPLRKS